MSFTVFTVRSLRTAVIVLYLDVPGYSYTKKTPQTVVKLKVKQPKASHLMVSNNSKSTGKIGRYVIEPFAGLHCR